MGEGLKIGILGGTFNPIHSTHLYIANTAYQEMQLDQVWFMPNKLPPHKQNEDILCVEDRVEMIKLAIQDVQYFKLNTIELELEGLSYTIHTMQRLKKAYPQHKFQMIIGADMVEYLPHWHDIDTLVQLISFIGVGRPGWTLDIQQHPYAKYVHPVESIPSPISSTKIRALIQEGKAYRFLVPEPVYAYIKERGLYV